MSKSLTRNIVLQTIYQILNIGFPLIITPYISRVLGAYNLGMYSFSSSIIGYFTLFAMLGTVNYGARCIAEVKDDEDKLAKSFWSIYLLQALISGIIILVYYVSLYLVSNIDPIFLLQGINIIACLFDISWFYFGLEKFTITIYRNLIIRLISILAIFLFVKHSEDINLYVLIVSGSTLLSLFVLWFNISNYVKNCKVTISDALHHLSANFVLFIPLLAMSVYHIMDKTMLGYMCDYSQSGFYYNADKIINIPIGILNGVGIVLLPAITSLYSQNKSKEALLLFEKSLDCVAFFSIALSAGIITVSKDFVPLYFGEEYYECIPLILILSPVLVIKGITNAVRTNFLIPLKLERVFIISVLCGAFINFVLNFVLIPNYGAIGAAIATLVAEIMSCFVQFYSIKKRIELTFFYKNIVIYIFLGFSMFFGVRLVASSTYFDLFTRLFLEIVFGMIIYTCGGYAFNKFTHNSAFEIVLNKIIK